MNLGQQTCTVGSLLEELYQNSGASQLWSLVRHTAGMLGKRVEDLGAVSDPPPLPPPPPSPLPLSLCVPLVVIDGVASPRRRPLIYW